VLYKDSSWRKVELGRQKILFLTQLVTDVELLLPLYYELQSRNERQLQALICVVAELLQRSPGAERVLRSRGIPFVTVQTDAILSGEQPDLQDVSAVITATETTLRPHKAAHALTQRANGRGIWTYTVQHGFENVGLTYFDEMQTSAMVEFASQYIFVWGSIERLHPEVRPETRNRCLPVGCCKAIDPSGSKFPKPDNRARLIAVFENIHWLRYNDNYRANFVSDVEQMALEFPDITFVIKPHPAGKWITKRYQGRLPQAENLIIANPEDPQWAPYSSADLIRAADGVITTPSTIALDAVRLECPVGLIAYDLLLQEYGPLARIRSTADWRGFLESLKQPSKVQALKQRGSDFLDLAVVPGNAAERIVNRVLEDIHRHPIPTPQTFSFGERRL